MLTLLLVAALSSAELSQTANPPKRPEIEYDLRCAAAITRQIRDLKDASQMGEREKYFGILQFFYGRLSETAPSVTSKQIETLAAVDDESKVGAEYCAALHQNFLTKMLREKLNDLP